MVSPRILPADPGSNYLAHRAEIDGAVRRVMRSGRYILGEEVRLLEADLARYFGVPYAVGVGSGTEALHLALRACGIGPGDEVVTVSHTAVATVAAIEMCGAMPVLADIDSATYTLDPRALEAAITPRTRAVVVVHLYGQPADLDAILKTTRAHGLRLIEDCAQSHGAVYRGRKAGAWGDVAALSFYPTKNLSSLGDGGAVITGSGDLAERVRLLRQYGWRERNVSEIPGFNSRLDEIQAAILRVKLRHLDAGNARRQVLAGRYRAELQDAGVLVPAEMPDRTHVYHQFVVRHPQRDALREHLRARGIGTLVHYPLAVHMQPAYRGRVRVCGSLTRTGMAAASVLSLPMYPELPAEQVETVAAAVRDWSRRAPA
jgi:dTDP-4-amino-4,6-dideoxygalactose transaminase